MFTKEFWLGDNGALVRSIRTFAQTATAMLTVATFTPFSIGQWVNVLVVSGTAAVVSVLMSLDRREALFTEPPAVQLVTSYRAPYLASESVAGCGESLR